LLKIQEEQMSILFVVMKIKIQYWNMFSQHLVVENDLECRSEVDQYLLDGCEVNIIVFPALL
jgi:hypothetical protein